MSDMDEAMARLEAIAFMQGFERDRRRAMDLVEQWRNNARAEAWDEAVSIAEQTAAATLSLDATLAALRAGRQEQDA